MKKFGFRLERVLDLKKREEDLALVESGRAVQALRVREAERDALLLKMESELLRMIDRLREGGVRPEESMRSAEYRVSLETLLRGARARVVLALKAVDAAARALEGRRVERRALEKAEEKAKERHQTETKIEIQRDLDEVAVRRAFGTRSS